MITTISVELAGATDGQNGLASVLLVGAEELVVAAQRDLDGLVAVSERELVSSAASPVAEARGVAEGGRVAVGRELVCAVLESLVASVACVAVGDCPSVDERAPGE